VYLLKHGVDQKSSEVRNDLTGRLVLQLEQGVLVNEKDKVNQTGRPGNLTVPN
jgi:hypothetical protein